MDASSSAGPIPWAETRARLARDRERLRSVLTRGTGPEIQSLFLHPGYLCVWLHRLAHHAARNGHRFLARIAWQLGIWITGADIHPHADLGPGLLIPYPAAVSISGKAGRDLTVMALGGVGGLLSKQEDIGAGPGHPVIGDGVYIGPHAGVLGPFTIGDGARIEAGCIVRQDLPAGQVVEPHPVRGLPRKRGA